MARPQPGQHRDPAAPQLEPPLQQEVAAQPPAQLQPVPQQMPPTQQFNSLTTVSFKGGWPGLFSGENQTKAMQRSVSALNARGQKVSAAVDDRWSFLKRVGMAILAVISLGFYVRSPNVILIAEPMN